MKRRVVITGLGGITPIGNDLASILRNVREGYNGIGPISKYPTDDRPAKLAAEVKDFDINDFVDKKTGKRMDQVAQYGVAASLLAMENSGLDKDEITNNERIAIYMSSGIGGVSTLQEEVIKGYEKGYNRISPFFVPKVITNMPSAMASIELGIHGGAYTPVTACAGGTNAIGDAFRAIRDGYSDICLAGGTEAAILETPMGGFENMKALSTSEDPNRASIPFDKERDGFVMGEGAAMLVLEDLDHALERGATIYAEVVGYGVTSDASHITAPIEDGHWAARSMELAMEDAGVSPDQVTSVLTHGTSTPLNDSSETQAIKKAFGSDTDIYINSTKSMTGHLLGAAGALEGLIAALELKENFLAPTINYRVEDPDCDLNIVANEVLETDVEYVLSDSLGFGGHNFSVLFKKYKG